MRSMEPDSVNSVADLRLGVVVSLPRETADKLQNSSRLKSYKSVWVYWSQIGTVNLRRLIVILIKNRPVTY